MVVLVSKSSLRYGRERKLDNASNKASQCFSREENRDRYRNAGRSNFLRQFARKSYHFRYEIRNGDLDQVLID